MLTAVTIQRGQLVEVRFPRAEGEEGTVEPKDGPSPIAPEVNELVWSAGAFVVFAVLMRVVLYPRLKKGMDSRYALIRSGHESADALRADAQAEVADYEAQLSAVKAEASSRIEAARATLESERAARLAEVNAGIAERREAARAAAESARSATRSDVESAAGDVVSRLVELSTGARPDTGAVRRAVSVSMPEGAAR